MSEIILVRHGQASFGADNYDNLSKIGETQAQVTGQHFADIRQPFTAVYCGHMERQIKTAESVRMMLLEKGLICPQPIRDAAFNEYDSRVLFESFLPALLKDEPEQVETLERLRTDRKAFQVLFNKIMKHWITGKYDIDTTPRWQDFKERVRKGILAIMTQHGSKQTVLISTSGGPISVAVQMALELTDDMTMEIAWQIQNSSITRLKYNNGRIMLSGFNDTTHLILKNDPSLLTYR
ncbi:phosphoglycerate mutase family protein [bacterium]|nr:phosphoglycerate mutase family protein [bacterium]